MTVGAPKRGLLLLMRVSGQMKNSKVFQTVGTGGFQKKGTKEKKVVQ